MLRRCNRANACSAWDAGKSGAFVKRGLSVRFRLCTPSSQRFHQVPSRHRPRKRNP